MDGKFNTHMLLALDILGISNSTIMCFEYISESDYAVLTRDFEDLVDDKVLEAVKNATVASVAAEAASVPVIV